MISLVPEWAHHYNEFWETIRRRNLWFIKLRYYAVLMLIFLIFTAELILDIEFSSLQFKVILFITFSILLYNIILHYIRRYVQFENKKFNPLHISLFQMAFDLTALTFLVYFTGTIESPLYMFFIFHMIVGSLILPGKIIYSAAVIVILIFGFLSYGEFYNIIPHYHIQNYIEPPLYNQTNFVLAFISIFSFVMIMSVVLTNRIARQLYKMEQNLYESLDKIQKSEYEKQKYIMSVVHEIKTPISALHSYIELIINKYLGPIDVKVEEKLKRALIRSNEAVNLINNVLQISKLRIVDDIEKENVDLMLLINQILEQQKINIESKKISIIKKYIDDNKYLIQGNKLLMEIAFSNLIGNAIKYNFNDGMIILNISINENMLLIEINDNGIGIPENEVKNIFNDFYRASNIKEKGFEGTGLGLSFVKQIIEKHKGEIFIESPSKIGKPDKPGCYVKIIFPLTNNQ